jgi:hypothetical protein
MKPLIVSADFIQNDIGLYINGRLKYKSFPGGVLTIIYAVLVIISIISSTL